MPPGTAVHVSHLSRVFANGAGIHDICLEALDQSVTAVIGPNGAGKTVLFSVIAGLCPADEGDVEVTDGRTVAYCPDVPQFESWLTATEIVETSLPSQAPAATSVSPRHWISAGWPGWPSGGSPTSPEGCCSAWGSRQHSFWTRVC